MLEENSAFSLLAADDFVLFNEDDMNPHYCEDCHGLLYDGYYDLWGTMLCLNCYTAFYRDDDGATDD